MMTRMSYNYFIKHFFRRNSNMSKEADRQYQTKIVVTIYFFKSILLILYHVCIDMSFYESGRESMCYISSIYN